jgi:predicted permease
MLQDYKLGLRMLLKFPGLTLAGGLALAIAIGIGAGWYDVWGKMMSPTIPLPDGNRIVLIEARNTLTNAPEPRLVRDFLEWRRTLRTIESLGAYRSDTRNLVVDDAAREAVQVAELTAAAFSTARVAPLVGRGLLDSDEVPGAPGVVVLGYDVWQRAFGGRPDAVGAVVKLGNAPVTVIGVMPKDFGYPLNHDAWTPLALQASYRGLEGGAISVIGRLAADATLPQASAELRVSGERMAAALPETHQHLRPVVRRLGESSDDLGAWQFALRNVPALLVILIACLSVGTLVYARTATREGEIAVRSALGAGRARIIGQLFVESLVLASVAAALGLVAADRVLAWGIVNINRGSGGAPFWLTPGLKLTTILYAGGLAAVCAAMLSLLPALKVTRTRLQSHLANRGAGGATLRFGRVWTGAMIAQVALTAIGIPTAMEAANEAMLKLNIRAAFPSREYVAARVDLDRPFAEEATNTFAARRALTFGALARHVAEEPGVEAVTFADRALGTPAMQRRVEVEPSAGAGPITTSLRTLAVGPGFVEAFERPIVAGRTFQGADFDPAARSVIVNEAFAREFSRDTGIGSPVGARLRHRAPPAGSAPDADDPVEEDRSALGWFEIVGVVRDFRLDPDDSGDEVPYLFHAASVETISPLVISARVGGNPASLVARLPALAAEVDAGLLVRDAQPLSTWVRQRDEGLIWQAVAFAGVTVLVLFLSALGIFSLVSVSVSRRTREIGLRTALGANPRHVLGGILSRGVALMGSGIAAGGALLLWAVGLGLGPSGRPAEDVVLFAGYLGATSVVMLAACLLACIGPAKRALRINPIDALRDA